MNKRGRPKSPNGRMAYVTVGIPPNILEELRQATYLEYRKTRTDGRFGYADLIRSAIVEYLEKRRS